MACSAYLKDFTERKAHPGETHMQMFTLVPAVMLVGALASGHALAAEYGSAKEARR
jgi:hypothetical protein